MKAFEEGYQNLIKILDTSDGRDHVWVYVAAENKRKDLGPGYTVSFEYSHLPKENNHGCTH